MVNVKARKEPKKFRLTKKEAEREFSYFDLSYGLRIDPAK